MDNILRINLDEKYKIKIDSIDELIKDLEKKEVKEKLFFSDVYKKAISALNDIVLSSNKAKASEQKNSNKKNVEDVFSKERNESNNIIAFTGERGTGKTSAMVSFARFLNTNPSIDIMHNEFPENALDNNAFHSLRVIDPSLFEESENIFEVIVSELFARFKERLDHDKIKHNNEQKGKLLNLFSDVYESIQILKADGKIYEGEALETLNKLARGARLRNNIKELICVYLKFMECRENSLLVIPIDDFDLNVKAATEMAEQIRKYLMIPNVVILMAVNIDQLINVKEQSLREEFERMIKSQRIFEDPKEMALRYLIKLIPEERRLVLPDIKITSKESKIIIENCNELNLPDENLESYILRLIFIKTNLVFLKPDYSSHYLIPSCLREIRELLILLNNMKTPSLKENKILNENFILFKQFFLNSWIKSNLEEDFVKTINEFEFTDLSLKNKFIITKTIDVIRSKYKVKDDADDITVISKYKERALFDFTSLHNIIDRGNIPSKVSIGDVLFFLNQVKLYRNNSEINKYVFAVETLYSFLFHERMHLMSDVEKAYSQVDKLINTFINVPLSISNAFIKKLKGESVYFDSREFFRINYDKVIGDALKEQLKNHFNHKCIISRGDFEFENNNRLNGEYLLKESKSPCAIFYLYSIFNPKIFENKIKTLFPLFSIDLLTRILNQRELKKTNSTAVKYSDYLEGFYNNFEKQTRYICDKYVYLVDYIKNDDLNSFLSEMDKDIINLFFDNSVNESSLYVDLLEVIKERIDKTINGSLNKINSINASITLILSSMSNVLSNYGVTSLGNTKLKNFLKTEQIDFIKQINDNLLSYKLRERDLEKDSTTLRIVTSEIERNKNYSQELISTKVSEVKNSLKDLLIYISDNE